MRFRQRKCERWIGCCESCVVPVFNWDSAFRIPHSTLGCGCGEVRVARRILTYEGKPIGIVSDQLFRPADRLNTFELRLAFAEAFVHMISEKKGTDLSADELMDRALRVMAPGRGFDQDRTLSVDELSAKYGLPHALVVRRMNMAADSYDQLAVWEGDSEVRKEVSKEAASPSVEEKKEIKQPEMKSSKPRVQESDSCPDYLKTVVGNEMFHWCNWLGKKEILLSKFHLVQYCMGDFKACPKRKF